MGGTREEVEIETIDSLCQNGLPPCDFIKIDTEGHEMKALKGGGMFLKKYKPIVLYEFNRETSSLAGYSFSDIAGFFTGISTEYEIFLITAGGGFIKILSYEWNVPFGCHIDLVAIPKSRNYFACSES